MWYLVLLITPIDAPSESVLLAQSFPTLEACEKKLSDKDSVEDPTIDGEVKIAEACVEGESLAIDGYSRVQTQ